MSEHEKRVREAIAASYRDHPFESMVLSRERAKESFDALLAEHRAEVERLEACIEEWKDASGLLVGEDPDGVTPKMLRDDLAQRERELFSARGAALEEAAQMVESEWDNPDVAVAIRALQSRPASVVPVEKVREVLVNDPEYGQAPAYMSGGEASAWESGWAAANRHAAEALGIDLNATPERVATSQAKGTLEDGAPCVCDHDIGWHWYGKNRGCMKKMPESGNSTCPCKAWTRASDAVTS